MPLLSPYILFPSGGGGGGSEQFETPGTWDGQAGTGSGLSNPATGTYRYSITLTGDPVQVGVMVQDKNTTPGKTNAVTVDGNPATLVPNTRDSEASDNNMEVSWWEIGAQTAGSANIDVDITAGLGGSAQNVDAQLTVMVRQGFAGTITGNTAELTGAGTATVAITSGDAGATMIGIAISATDSGGGTLIWGQDTATEHFEDNNQTNWPSANAVTGVGYSQNVGTGTVTAEVQTTDFRALLSALVIEP